MSAALPGTYSPSSTVLGSRALAALPHAVAGSLPDAVATAVPGMIRGHDDFVHVRGQELALNVSLNGVSFWENPHSALSAGIPPTRGSASAGVSSI